MKWLVVCACLLVGCSTSDVISPEVRQEVFDREPFFAPSSWMGAELNDSMFVFLWAFNHDPGGEDRRIVQVTMDTERNAGYPVEFMARSSYSGPVIRDTRLPDPSTGWGQVVGMGTETEEWGYVRWDIPLSIIGDVDSLRWNGSLLNGRGVYADEFDGGWVYR